MIGGLAIYDRDMSDDELKSPTSGWDIHCHTRFSDGTESPATLVSQGKALGLHGVGIADHDTWNGWPEAEAAAKEQRFPLIRGTEITSSVDHTSVHVLGFLYDPANEGLAAMFRRTREAREDRVREMVERISRDYPQITWGAVQRQIGEGNQTTVGRPHIADALVAAGICSDREEAFSTVVSSRSKYYVPVPSPTPAEVTQTVKKAGGAVVVAHVGDRSRNKRLLPDERLEELIDAGLDGIEVYHRGNLPDQRERLLGIARRHHLVVTGGSDWHGKGKPNPLGENLTSDEMVRRLAEGCYLPILRP